MTTERDTTRILRSWLEDGATVLPDRVLDSVLAQLPATRQRRSVWTWPALARVQLGVAAALVVSLALLVSIAVFVVPGQSRPTVSPEPSRTSEPTFELPELVTIHAFEDFAVPLTLRSPAGWGNCGDDPGYAGICPDDLRDEPQVSVSVVDRVVVDPCHPEAGFVDLQPGVEGLAQAIARLPGFTASPVTDVLVDGRAGRELTVIAPLGASCVLQTWGNVGFINGVSALERNLIRIVEVDGTFVMIAAPYGPEHDARDVALAAAVMDSVHFQP